MSFDQPAHSFNHPSGEPTTPTRTPTLFGDSTFQTPKLESSFYDPRVTWDTSDPYASSPEFLRTPQRFGLNTPSNHLRQTDDANHLKSGVKVEGTDTAKRIHAMKPNGGGSFGDDGPRSAKSAASMQTPPPSSASRRKVTGLEHDSAPGNHLETPSRFMGSSPRMLAHLQSSPDLFQLGTLDPSTSPFLPQAKLFWDDHLDHQQPGSDVGLSGTSNVDLFGSNGSNTLNLPTSTSAMHDPIIPQLPAIEGTVDLPEFHGSGFTLPPTTTATTGPADAAFFPAPFSTSPRLPSTRAEDPAMFLSSPARRFGGLQPTPEKKRLSKPTRQPYHHQTEESKREQLRRAQSLHRMQPPYEDEDDDDDEDFTPRGVRPGLTRSLTQSSLSSSSHRPVLGSSSGAMASTSGIRKSPSKGRLSPVKQRNTLSRSNSVATSFPTRSPSVVLKIGKDGRAKAEMQTVPEVPTGLTDPITGLDLEGSTTESEYDGAEYSEYPVPTRQPSFTFSDAGRPMLARSDSGSRPVSKGSYTSTVASGPSGRASPWQGSSRGGSRRPQLSSYRPASSDDWRRTPSKRQTPVLNSDFTYASSSSASDVLAEPEEDSGDAQHALRKVLRERGRNLRPQVASYGPRPTLSSRPPAMTHLRSSPPRFSAELDINSRHIPSSPTTMTDPDLATPITNRYSNYPSNGTRCVCNSMENGGHLMIQCESCNHWLHTKCVGLERSHLPSVYVCMFCAQTPSRQRVRGPLGAGQGPPSPLAHKSFRFR
ncbi:PHD finger domain protein [Aspergillus chevalieri]|uniref:PHD-type domain-containing protein n=1 Tax=Aspergillus chevalieri TaxID=182096 RepID=A0A7R7VJZ2_ASPCH|nr:uncharacterized protein ACHE_30085S [Aspergillus chevalieri]BCR86098.1 hypothetical protein ACHE_30085S [Aspergillus chevalieri]